MNSICFIVNKYPNEYEPYMLVFLQQLAWEIADMGKKVTVICPLQVNLNHNYSKIPYHTKEKSNNGNDIDVFWPKTIGLGQSHYILGKSPIGITTFFLEKSAAKVLRRESIRPDVLYGHFLAPSGIVVARLGKRFGIPAYFALGESHDTISQFGAKKAKAELDSIAGVISVSTALKKWIVEAGVVEASKVKVIPNAYNDNRFKTYDKTECRKRFGLPENETLVAFVGAFNERKGILRVCEAVEKVKGVKLICAGKGDQQPYGTNCIFSKSLKPEEIPFFNCAADFFVLPTIKEGCSNAIIEALACGLPVISSNGAFNDDILSNEYAIRVDPTNVDELADAISQLVVDVEKRERMSKAALVFSKTLTLAQRAKTIVDFIDYNSK